MCGTVKHDEYGNHIEEEIPAINVTEEFETLTEEAPIEVTEEFTKVEEKVEAEK